MMGLLLNHKECQEIHYLLQKEMDEMLLDISDQRIDGVVKQAMEDRYDMVFKIYSRIATPKEISKYIRNKKSHQNQRWT